jgi:hypothetical protein
MSTLSDIENTVTMSVTWLKAHMVVAYLVTGFIAGLAFSHWVL